jgi:serine/threonine protein kinase|tara:strand:+ start:3212 stop:3745 length:534 start_codon:yes stop_codon:yes gene_type:complete
MGEELKTLEKNTLVGNGRYRVGEEINRGGTAVVYEGYDNALGMRVALKVRPPPFPPHTRRPSSSSVVVSSTYRHPLTASASPPPQVMNVAPDSTIAVPLKSVKREIKYASKLGARAAQGDLNVVRLLNVVQEGQVRETLPFRANDAEKCTAVRFSPRSVPIARQRARLRVFCVAVSL